MGIKVIAWVWLACLALWLLLIFSATSPAHGQTILGPGTGEKDSRVITVSGGSVTFPDTIGTQSNNFEVVITGAPATVTITLSGCMVGGTCTLLTTSTATTNGNLSVSGGPYNNYQANGSWTGGTAPTITLNRIGAVALHFLLNGTTGEMVVATGAATGATVPLYYRTKQFPGNDPGARAKACFEFAATVSAFYGYCDGSDDSVVNPISINPFRAAVQPGRAVWQIPCNTALTNVPIAVFPGDVVGFNSHTEMLGCGRGEVPGGSSFASSTLLVNAGTYPQCQSTLVVTGCTNTGGTVTTVTNDDPGGTGQMAVTGVGTSFLSTWVGCMFMAPATVVTSDSWGLIKSVADSTHLVVTQNNNRNQDQGAAVGYSVWCPVVSLGATSQLYGQGNANYDIKAHDFTVDAGNVAGGYGIANYYVAEFGRFYDMTIRGFTAVGMDIESNQPQSSGPYERLFFSPGTACVAATLDVVVRGSGGGPHALQFISSANGHGCPNNTTQQTAAWALDTDLVTIADDHFENVGTAIEVADKPACIIGCPQYRGNTSANQGMRIQRIDASCSQHATRACTTVMDVGSFSPIVDSSIDYLDSDGNFTNLLVDHQNTCTSTDSDTLRYAFNNAGTISQSTLTQCPRPIAPGATGTITGTALLAGQCDTGTATVTGAAVGYPVSASSTDGTLQAGSFFVQASVTGANTVTVEVCAAVAGTPASKAYNVKVYFPGP